MKRFLISSEDMNKEVEAFLDSENIIIENDPDDQDIALIISLTEKQEKAFKEKWPNILFDHYQFHI